MQELCMFPVANVTPSADFGFLDWVKLIGMIYLISVGFVIYISSRASGPIIIPGDIYVRKAGRTLYIPLASSLVVTIVIFLILRKFLVP
jgi:Protein of unknown function (DUF2905)